MQHSLDNAGTFDNGHAAFLRAVLPLRPRLHRYCARMMGSPLDGEDVVQEALFEAYQKLELFDPTRPMGPWLARIAHNRCIDALRRRKSRAAAEASEWDPDMIVQPQTAGAWADNAMERLVVHLPPKQRACVLLKDVMDYTLEEIAELIGSTIGGVKAALNRGRTKLQTLPEKRTEATATLSVIHQLYMELFNNHDWDGLRRLVSEDASLRVSDVYAGALIGSYFERFLKMPFAFRLVPGKIDDEAVLLLLGGVEDGEVVTVAIQLETADGVIERIRHFCKCEWLLRSATRTDNDSGQLKRAA